MGCTQIERLQRGVYLARVDVMVLAERLDGEPHPAPHLGDMVDLALLFARYLNLAVIGLDQITVGNPYAEEL